MRRLRPSLLLGLLLAGGLPFAGPSGAAPAGNSFDRARTAYAALEAHFAISRAALYREHATPAPGDRSFAYLWAFSQAQTAALDIASLPGGDPAAISRSIRLRDTFFAQYWDERSAPAGGASYPLPAGGGDKYYDDNNWIGLNLLELYRATGDRAALAGASRAFNFVISGWDADPRHPAPGGIFWTQAPFNTTRDRNTVSTAPAAQLALELYGATGDRAYLDWAVRCFEWVERNLKDPSDGLYWDRIELSGNIEKTKWSYNQGGMLAAATLFYRYTGDPARLTRAREIAAASLAYYAAEDRLWQQDPIFNAIYFRDLQLLELTLPPEATTRYLDVMVPYAERAWNDGRDPASGLFHFGRAQPVSLLNQAAAVQLFALMATDQPPGPFADSALLPIWNRADAPVVARQAARGWLWGPGPSTGGLWERFDEGQGGRRLVQYFDKSRMEVNAPNGDRAAPFFVTQGLLVSEMILGRMQVGENRFETRAAAQIPFGDPDDATGATYASLSGLLYSRPSQVGAPVALAVGRDGRLRPADPGGITCGAIVGETQHCVASVFWDYLNSSGTVYAGGKYATGALFQPLFYATGLPITEAYWTDLQVNGRRQTVLVQAFERRVLTYNPANPLAWQIEMGNVGRHYYLWRYGTALPPPAGVGAPPRAE